MFKVDDRICEVSSTPGAGTYTLGGVVAGFRPFSVLGANNYTMYFATDGISSEWGIGRYLSTPDRLERTHVLGSTVGGTAINWGTGTRTLRCGPVSQLQLWRRKSIDIQGGAGTTVLTQEQMRADVMYLHGALTGNRVLEVDDTPWVWVVHSDATGNFTTTLRIGAAGSSVSIPAGRAVVVYSDGTSLIKATPAVSAAEIIKAVGIEVGDGTVGAPAVKVGDEQNGLYSPAASELAAAVGGANGWTLSSTGLAVAQALSCGGAITPGGMLNLSGAASGQIQFPATQNASAGANTLDDYEEGTFTPDLGGTATYSNRMGTYTKIGRFVHIQTWIIVLSIGTGDTDSFSGLPFSIASQEIAALAVSNWADTVSAMFALIARIHNAAPTSVQLYPITAAQATPNQNPVYKNSTIVTVGGGYNAAA